MEQKKKRSFLTHKITLIIFGIAILLLIGFAVLSVTFLSPVNKKDKEVIPFSVESGWSKNIIANKLEDKGLIRNALFFKLYIKLNKKTELYAGTYNLSKNMSVDKIISVLNSNDSLENKSVSVTFIEGKRISDYANTIAKYFDYSADDVIKVADSKEFVQKEIDTYWFIDETLLNDKIYHPLEGYLFPDTYVIKANASIKEILDLMINNMGKKLDGFKSEIEESKYSVHEMLTLSSIIELEGAKSEDRKEIAGVFYNRLKAGSSLGSDVTTYYAAKRPNFSKDLRMAEINECNAYNTRNSCLNGKLPIGPIASPSVDSIVATIEPKETTAFYFVADKNKKIYFNDTLSGHEATVAKLKNNGLWYEY